MRFFLKKINILLVLATLTLSGCNVVFDNIKLPKTSQKAIIAVILPLSGSNSKVGAGMLRSIMLSYKNNNPKNFILKIYDTQSNPNIAHKMAVKAYSDNANIILGPLTSEETSAILSYPDIKDIPVFTFSNDIDLVKKFSNVYIMSPLVNLEVEAAIQYAIKTGSTKFAVMVPNNKYGQIIASTAKQSITAKNQELVKVVTYPTNTAILTNDLKKLIPISNLNAYLQKINKLEHNQHIFNKKGNQITKVSLPKLDFDTLIIGDSGNRLIIASNHLPAINLDYKNIKILGLANWENPLILHEPILNDSYFASFNDISKTTFFKGFKGYYNMNPSLLDATAYDSLIFVSNLIYKDADDHIVIDSTPEVIMKIKAEKAILGTLSMRPERVAQRVMQIKRINKEQVKIIKKIEPSEFSSIPDYRNITSDK